MFERSFITAACAVLRPAAGTLSYALAGHPPPLLQAGADAAIELLDERGIFLGMMPSATYATATVPLPSGARLVLYTDGITETMGPSDDLFGIDRLRAFAAAERRRPTAPFAGALFAALRAFAGRSAVAHDDVTLIIADLVSA
jgi:sigma-B regulation protein RsbU (phosphoserine phosphatase)